MDAITTSEDRQSAMLAHLLGTLGSWILPVIGGIIAPAILHTSRRSEFVTENAREALNFQITLGLAMLVCYGVFFTIWLGMMMSAVSAAQAHDSMPMAAPPAILPSLLGAFAVGLAIGMLILLANVVFGTLGSVAAYNGRVYRYPIAIPFIRSKAPV